MHSGLPSQLKLLELAMLYENKGQAYAGLLMFGERA